MAFAYHGKYCGPGWSAGKYQSSVESDVPAMDEFDETCKLHDAVYARRGNLRHADREFFLRNILSIDPRRHYAAVAVGGQSVLRDFTSQPAVTLDHSKQEESNTMRKQQTPTPAPLTRAPASSLRGGANGSRAKSTNGSCPPMTMKQAPVAMAVAVPSARQSPAANRGAYTVTNREYVGYVSSSSSFTLTSMFTNPGLTTTFPWLSNVANNFDRYIFRKLRYTFVPSVSTATSGRIALVWNYNAADPPPTTKAGALSIAPANETSVWSPNVLDIPCTGQIQYTRDGLPNNVDLKTTDMGTLYIVTDLASGTATIGELYVEYVVEFMNPHAHIPPTTEIYSVTSSAADQFPNVGTTVIGGDSVSDSTTANTVRINASGRYLCAYQTVGTGVTGFSTFAASDGGLITSVTTSTSTVNAGATSASGMLCCDIRVDPKTQFTNVSTVFGGTTITKAYLIITRIDSGITPVFTNS